jgi:hypothetical protein
MRSPAKHTVVLSGDFLLGAACASLLFIVIILRWAWRHQDLLFLLIKENGQESSTGTCAAFEGDKGATMGHSY